MFVLLSLITPHYCTASQHNSINESLCSMPALHDSKLFSSMSVQFVYIYLIFHILDTNIKVITEGPTMQWSHLFWILVAQSILTPSCLPGMCSCRIPTISFLFWCDLIDGCEGCYMTKVIKVSALTVMDYLNWNWLGLWKFGCDFLTTGKPDILETELRLLQVIIRVVTKIKCWQCP